METRELHEIENILSYQFQNKALLEQAFTRSSYAKEHNVNDNEVLEFIGDTVLSMAVVSRLANHFTSENENGLTSEKSESELTDLRSKLIRTKTLADRMDVLDLVHYLLLGKGDVKNKVSEQESVKEDLFEAIVGAVAIDSNFDWNTINDLVDCMLDIESFIENDFRDVDDNSIGDLQSWFQKNGYGVPDYSFREINDFISGQKWYCSLYIDYQHFEGQSDTKIGAKKICAQSVINWLVENGHYYNIKDEIKEPSLDQAVNQLQELWQKGYFSEPVYEFEESIEDGQVTWEARVDINEYSFYCSGISSTKKEAKKRASYNMLLEILKPENKR